MAYPVIASVTTAVGAASCSIAAPSGLSVGDLIVLTVSASSSNNLTANASLPSGYTTVVSANIGSNAYIFLTGYKIAVSADISAFPITFGSTNNRIVASAQRITGADTSNPVLVSSTNVSGSGTSITGTTVSPIKQSLFVMNAILGANNNGQTSGFTTTSVANSNPSWTNDINVSTSDSADEPSICAAHASETGAPGSATGTITAAYTGYSATHSALAFLVVQSPVITPAVFGAVYAMLTATIRNLVNAVFGATYAELAPTVTTSTKWSRQQKSTTSTWTTQAKEIT